VARVNTTGDGLITYFVIVASVFGAMAVMIKARTWLGFIVGMFAVFFVGLVAVAFVVR
jgi:hypothetical protein